MCISLHPRIVWISGSLPRCARCLCFLPVSFVLLDISVGSSSVPLRTSHVPSALPLSPVCPPFPSRMFSLMSFSHPSPCPTFRGQSCRPFPHRSSSYLLGQLSFSLTHLCHQCLSPQDSASSTGSAELTGIKELDDLSQEIAQLQR